MVMTITMTTVSLGHTIWGQFYWQKFVTQQAYMYCKVHWILKISLMHQPQHVFFLNSGFNGDTRRLFFHVFLFFIYFVVLDARRGK